MNRRDMSAVEVPVEVVPTHVEIEEPTEEAWWVEVEVL